MDGKTAAVQTVAVLFDIGALRIADAADTSIAFWSLSGLTALALPGELLHVHHKDAPGALLTSRDPALPVALRRAGVAVAGLPTGRALGRQAAIYGAAIAVLAGLVYLSIPAVSRMLARRVPLGVEEQMALQLDGFLAKYYCRTEAATRALDTLSARLDHTAPAGTRAVRIDVINLGMVNALTFPGGKIAVTRGLIDAAGGPDELAGVLAHELEHVRQRHIMAHIIRSSILSLGWAVTVGDFSGLLVIDPSTMFEIANLRFSRKDEAAADLGALDRLDGAHIARKGFADFFERMRQEIDAIPAWLSSHPDTAARLQAINKSAPGSGLSPALADADWQALKAACADKGEVGEDFFSSKSKSKPKSKTKPER
jgi:Zn-dependent protease with chaperone function